MAVIRTMQFVSVYFIIFFIFALIGYYCCNRKHRYLFLLICNILFYCSWISDVKEFIPLVAVMFVTWGGSLLIEQQRSKLLMGTVIIVSISGTANYTPDIPVRIFLRVVKLRYYLN